MARKGETMAGKRKASHRGLQGPDRPRSPQRGPHFVEQDQAPSCEAVESLGRSQPYTEHWLRSPGALACHGTGGPGRVTPLEGQQMSSKHRSQHALTGCLVSLLAFLAVGWAKPLQAAEKRTPPNIVIIFTDDQGYADIGCFGAKGFETPNLDRMAREGMRFTDFYVAQAVCSASRAALLTGCYPNRVGVLGALGPSSRHGISDREKTIAQVLRPPATIDELPTVAHLAGAPLPEHKIDGLDIGPLLLGKEGPKSPHESYFFYWDRHLQAVRSGKWKLHFPHPYRSLGRRPGGKDGEPADYSQARTELALFDLENDIGEKKNVASEHPEIVARLKKLAEAMRADLGDSATRQEGSGVRPAGRLDD